jgi:DNA-binding NtrC family response regulator
MDTTGPKLWLSYSLAKSLNRHRWGMDQLIFVGRRGEVESSIRLFPFDVVPRVRQLFEDPACARIERCINKELADMLEILGSESFGEDWYERDQLYSKRALGEISEDELDRRLWPMHSLAKSIIDGIAVAVLEEFGDHTSLANAFRLGELVDRGVRPLDFAESVYFESLNGEHWKEKRSPRYRRSVSARRKAFAFARETRAKETPDPCLSIDDSDYDGLDGLHHDSAELPRRPWQPRRTRCATRLCEVRATSIESDWGNQIRSLWAIMKMQGPSPKALLAIYERPQTRGFVPLAAQIDERARQCFLKFEDTPIITETSSTLEDPKEGQTSIKNEELFAAIPSRITAIASPSSEEDDYTKLLSVKRSIDKKKEYIGQSRAILKVFEKIKQFNTEDRKFQKSGELPKPLLILGDSGAGKSALARVIHDHSGRPNAKFANESASDNEMTDPGAMKARWVGYGTNPGFTNFDPKGSNGILQDNAGGTVFLDEVAEVPKTMQLLLMRILDDQEIPLSSGQGKPIKPSVRLIFATNKDLDQEVKQGRFRNELLQRIKHRSITIPPLIERLEDIFSFLESKFPRRRPTFAFLLALLSYPWPGNIRELVIVLEKVSAKVGKKGKILRLEDLDLDDPCVLLRVKSMSGSKVESAVLSALASILRSRGFERNKRGAGLQMEMARLLKMSEATLSRRMEQLNI